MEDMATGLSKSPKKMSVQHTYPIACPLAACLCLDIICAKTEEIYRCVLSIVVLYCTVSSVAPYLEIGFGVPLSPHRVECARGSG